MNVPSVRHSLLTHTFRWRRHCSTAHAWWCGLPYPHQWMLQSQSWILCVLYWQCQFNR